MKYKALKFMGVLLALTGLATASANAAPKDSLSLVLKDQQFQPARLTIPAGKQIKLMVSNHDSAPAEFESYDIGVEKVIPGQTDIPVYVGPLDPGTYSFFNDFDQQATGTLVVE